MAPWLLPDLDPAPAPAPVKTSLAARKHSYLPMLTKPGCTSQDACEHVVRPKLPCPTSTVPQHPPSPYVYARPHSRHQHPLLSLTQAGSEAHSGAERHKACWCCVVTHSKPVMLPLPLTRVVCHPLCLPARPLGMPGSCGRALPSSALGMLPRHPPGGRWGPTSPVGSASAGGPCFSPYQCCGPRLSGSPGSGDSSPRRRPGAVGEGSPDRPPALRGDSAACSSRVYQQQQQDGWRGVLCLKCGQGTIPGWYTQDDQQQQER
jgi:hypothetical protein